MNSGCSASNGCAVCSADAVSTVSCHQWSFSDHATSSPVRRTTSTCSTDGQLATASSTVGFNADGLPRR